MLDLLSALNCSPNGLAMGLFLGILLRQWALPSWSRHHRHRR